MERNPDNKNVSGRDEHLELGKRDITENYICDPRAICNLALRYGLGLCYSFSVAERRKLSAVGGSSCERS